MTFPFKIGFLQFVEADKGKVGTFVKHRLLDLFHCLFSQLKNSIPGVLSVEVYQITKVIWERRLFFQELAT